MLKNELDLVVIFLHLIVVCLDGVHKIWWVKMRTLTGIEEGIGSDYLVVLQLLTGPGFCYFFGLFPRDMFVRHDVRFVHTRYLGTHNPVKNCIPADPTFGYIP